ncbi:MAG: IS5 family transposase ISBugl2 [Burkholderia gladioli]|nr:MAG: IS5 family transposase ISBugl2 [Burkholderia gladioli]
MEVPIIDEELWTLIEPLLPVVTLRVKSDPERPRALDCVALNGVLFVLRTGIRWNHWPTRLGFDLGAICWHRLDGWKKTGVRDRLHVFLLKKLCAAGQLDLSYVESVRAVGVSEKLARIP